MKYFFPMLILKGGVSKGNRHGQGVQLYPESNDLYKGVFRQDLRHGSGLCLFGNGMIYRGEWREDKMNGVGTLFCPAGELIEA